MKQIDGFENYFVDKIGNVYSNRKCQSNLHSELRKLKPSVAGCGYLLVVLMKDGKRCNKLVHRLVALAYIDNPYNKPQVNHKNGIKTDCRAVNLEWSTGSENTIHAINTELMAIGERRTQSKLTNIQVLLIREDKRAQSKIASDYNISQQLVSYVKNNKCWKHI
jgi:hypothetical protein